MAQSLPPILLGLDGLKNHMDDSRERSLHTDTLYTPTPHLSTQKA